MRLFFAIDLSPDIKSALLTVQDQLSDIDGRAVAGENFHITLSFLGEVNHKGFESILDNFQPPEINRFTVNTAQLSYWPRPKILALSVLDPKQRLANCKKQIEANLAAFGHFKKDKKPFAPHITLFRGVETLPDELGQVEKIIHIAHICLMQSIQTRNGVSYQVLEQWPLSAGSVKQQLLGR